jgi:hypothetical protein
MSIKFTTARDIERLARAARLNGDATPYHEHPDALLPSHYFVVPQCTYVVLASGQIASKCF